VKDIGVAAVQQPPIADPDRHPGMTSRVSMERHQQNVADRLDRLEPHPRLTPRAVDRPTRLMFPLLRPVAVLLRPGPWLHRRRMLDIEDMHLRRREVAQSTSMVDVEVSQHDVTHISCLETETPNLR